MMLKLPLERPMSFCLATQTSSYNSLKKKAKLNVNYSAKKF